MSDEVSLSVETMPALKLGFCQLDEESISVINNYVDENAENLDDLSSKLVGQIKQNKKSSQLKFNMKDKVPHQFGEFLIKVVKKYVSEHHLSDGNQSQYTYKISQMWTVHSYAGDYNPLHEHGTETGRGISCILYLKVPALVDSYDTCKSDLGSFNLKNNSGLCDGYTQFIWGSNGNRDIFNFKHLTDTFVRPEVGKLIMFPIWLKHQVMPFFGEGERRSLSANIDIHV